MFRRVSCAAAGLLMLAVPSLQSQELVVVDQFDPVETGNLIGTAFDVSTDQVWLYDGGATIFGFTRDGTAVGSVPNPDVDNANDADLDFAAVDIVLNGVPVPAGTLLFIHGETASATIYAIETATGTVLASLDTDFGANHVVGGSLSEARNSLFLVADRLDPTPNTIAEIDLATGATLQSFPVGSGAYTVNFGDIAVDPATGNILVVSSLETTIREISPTGTVIRDIPLATGVGSLSGIAVDKVRGELYLGGTGPTVWRVADVGQRLNVPLPSGGAAGDRFGQAVATDNNLYVVGRPGADGGTGEVIVYRVEGETLVVDDVITVPGARTATNFGAALALEGDRLVVGAPASAAAAKGPTNALQAAIYQRLSGGWTMKAEFTSGATADDFGASVAMEGQVLVIGAPADDAAVPGAGAAHVFVLDDNDSQLFTRKLAPENAQTDAGFGRSVAVSTGRVAVGAPAGGKAGADRTGVVSLFGNVGDNLANITSIGTVTGSSSAGGDGFGTSVAMEGTTVAIGSPGEDGAGVDRGAVYLFDPVSLTQRARLEPAASQDNAGFGQAVAMAAGELGVGAPGFDTDGAVFRFSPSLNRIRTVFPPSGALGFGSSVAISRTGLLAGAPDSNGALGATLASRDPDLVLREGFE